MSERLRAELTRVAEEFGDDVTFTLERPRDPSHGDLATNLAMQLARRDRTNPRLMAERVVAAIAPNSPKIMPNNSSSLSLSPWSRA